MASKQLTVRDIMQKNFVSIRPEMDIYEAIDTIIAKELMGVPVTEGNKLLGIFSEKDCFRVLSNWMYMTSNPTGGIVAHYMTTKIITLPVNMDLSGCVTEILKHDYRGLPVIENKKLVGLVSRRDILKRLMLNQKNERTAQYPDSKYGSNIPELK